MSKIVLGGAGLSTLSKIEFDYLLGTASGLGIDEIDTAPSYGSSELSIGRCVSTSGWKINTKFGQPGGMGMGRKEVLRSVDKSLANLKIEMINTLFIHSLPATEVSAEVLGFMNELKASGKILNVGYSGDGRNLQSVAARWQFDSLQASLNILDLSNYEMVRKTTIENWYIKRPMCNQAFKLKPKLELSDFYFRLKKGEPVDTKTYSFRYKKLFGNRILNRMKSQEIFSFLLSLNLNAKLIVGTTNVSHLEMLSRLVGDPELWSEAELDLHFTKWKTLASYYNWEALV